MRFSLGATDSDAVEVSASQKKRRLMEIKLALI